MEEKPAGLDFHEYALPLTAAAPIITGLPAHKVSGFPALAAGSGFIVITMESDLLQPVAVTVSVR